MRNKLVKLLILCSTVFLGLSQNISSQNGIEDFNSWIVAGLDYKVNDKLQLGFESQLRLKEDISVVDQYFGELSMIYKLPYGFRFGGAIRYIRDNDTRGNIQGYENQLRYNFDISFNHKIKRLGLRYRVRYQNRNELGVSNNEGDVHREAIRIKTRLKYNFKKWKLDPILSAEFFNRFRENGLENGFNKYRLGLGTNYKVTNANTLGLSYLYEREYSISNPETVHIIKLSYTFSTNSK